MIHINKVMKTEVQNVLLQQAYIMVYAQVGKLLIHTSPKPVLTLSTTSHFFHDSSLVLKPHIKFH